MSRFIQLHMLTAYPPSNLNRDDLGRPKTARMGGIERLRASSQSLKRAWRISDLFKAALDGHVGTRTKRIGGEVKARLMEKGVAEKKAVAWAKEIAAQFGKLKSKDEKIEIEQLAHISPEEWESVNALADLLAQEKRAPEKEELDLLRRDVKAVDIAFFGRMLASRPDCNVEAAVQVSHAVTINSAIVEDDYFTAVDDLNKGEEDSGAGHLGEAGFGSGVFYVYVCINAELLAANLNSDLGLVKKALSAFTETAAKVGPSGKQNSFASRAYASYLLAECGDQQPRSLSAAFLKPVNDHGILSDGIEKLKKCRENMEKVYGPCADDYMEMNAETGKGSLKDIINFVIGSIN
ncbi:MAG: type I-E CRISPR-associated protein Cas7/Cse4/CasC [Desulfobacteraceae bacterium]|nr:type I-E CRISPR-associated protein Cas7/Cse4/CasC [Desulfobacteraceae bacterium]